MPVKLFRASLAELEVEDEESFRHVGIYEDLKRHVSSLGPAFLVPAEGTWLGWDRALLLNLLFWEPGTADVLASRSIVADVVMHVAWHDLANKNLPACVESHLLGESIASAFDLYLVGRLLGHSPESSFLESQVGRMSEAAADAGVDEDAFQALLTEVASQPERAFEELRELLFDASRALLSPRAPADGLLALEAFEGHRYACLMHHYELASWVMRSRLESQGAPESATATALELDAALRRAPDAVAHLERTWLSSAQAAAR
ncbi:MAG: hypothetical protein IPM79_15355 [Polyangiaceae bacterium]|jgi:hypothetical protein|nr:hypothetical protein [Polyangiaceae bacterium]